MSTPLISLGEYRKLARKPPKYRNRPKRIDGIYFPSGKEAQRYLDLQLLQKAGAITGLILHPRYPLEVMSVVLGEYIADFQYYERGQKVVEDVKSKITRTPIYRWKIRHLKAQYGIEVRET